MRDLLFKNLTSLEKKRRIIASSETVDKEGLRSVIHRHFICLVREVPDTYLLLPQPQLYILKKSNRKEKQEKFFCRIKSSTYLAHKGKAFLVFFVHSLSITILALPKKSTLV